MESTETEQKADKIMDTLLDAEWGFVMLDTEGNGYTLYHLINESDHPEIDNGGSFPVECGVQFYYEPNGAGGLHRLPLITIFGGLIMNDPRPSSFQTTWSWQICPDCMKIILNNPHRFDLADMYKDAVTQKEYTDMYKREIDTLTRLKTAMVS
jgi:hypothetical protein